MGLIKENEKMISVHFGSILEIINGMSPSTNKSNADRYDYYKEYKRGGAWFGPTCENASNIIEKSLLGDKVLYEKYLKPKISRLSGFKNVTDYEHSIQVVKRKKIKSSMGDELDIHKIYQGQLDKAWTKNIRVEVSQKFHLVTLFIDYGGNCDENVADSLWSAAVSVKIAGELEAAGKSVQIVCGSITSRGIMDGTKRLLSESIVIKRFNEKLSMERLSALSHLGSFRVFGFMGRCCINQSVPNDLGVTKEVSENNFPIHLSEEVKAGHTKFVIINKARSYNEAQLSIEHCYKQMVIFSGKK